MTEAIKLNRLAFIALAVLAGSGFELLAKATDTRCTAVGCPDIVMMNAADPMLVIADRFETAISKFGVVGPDGQFDKTISSTDRTDSSPIGPTGGPTGN